MTPVRRIGFITLANLGRLQRTGADPKAVHDELIAEAKRLHPQAGAVILRREGDGFAILAVDEDARARP